MSLIRSGSTLVLLLPSGSRYWPAPGWPAGICFSGGGGCWPGARGTVGRAVDVLLADQRLRADLAAGVLAEVLEAGVGDFELDDRLAGNVDRTCRLRSAIGSPGIETLTDLIVPTLAPATRTCSPLTMNEPLSKIARTT